MYKHGINNDMLNKHYSQTNIKKVNDMNVDEIPDDLLKLKAIIKNENNNRLDSFERKVQTIRKYRVLNKDCDVSELKAHCEFCNKDIMYNNTRDHGKQKTHLKNKTIYYNNKLKVCEVDSYNVLKFDT